MLWWSTTVALPGRMGPAPRPIGIGVVAVCSVGAMRVYVTVARVSIFSGYGEMRSIYDRDVSMDVAPRRWRALISNTSVVNSRVTSTTGSPSLAKAATGKVMMVSLFAALTAWAIGAFGSATTL